VVLWVTVVQNAESRGHGDSLYAAQQGTVSARTQSLLEQDPYGQLASVSTITSSSCSPGLRYQSSTSSPGMTSSMHAQSCYSQLSPVSARASSLFDKKSGFNDEGSYAQQAPSSPLVLPANRKEVRLFACFLFSESAGGGMCV